MSFKSIEQGQWANLPAKLLLDIIHRVVEESTMAASRPVIVFCASVCQSWRKNIIKEIVKTPEDCDRLSFPILVKQLGPRESLIRCFIKRDKANSVYRLYFGMIPSEDERDKLLLAAKRIRRLTSIDFVISLVADDFSQADNTYAGKLRSNFLGNKFTIYDNQPPNDAAAAILQQHGQLSRRRLPACNSKVATVSYEVNGNCRSAPRPRSMHCTLLHSIPFSSIPQSLDEKSSPTVPVSKAKELVTSQRPLVLKNKAPMWHEKSQSWCLNFKGRVIVASVKNFQLLVAEDASDIIPVAKQEKVVLQFGKMGEDIFAMDYCYPLSAFQAFAICLSIFDPKPAL